MRDGVWQVRRFVCHTPCDLQCEEFHGDPERKVAAKGVYHLLIQMKVILFPLNKIWSHDTKSLLLVLTLVLGLGEFEDDVGHVIPGVVDADEQQ
jgi:hypothetical protein